jgi:Tol biopolymer transport system component
VAASPGHGDSQRGLGMRWPVAPFVVAGIVAAVISIAAATRCTSGDDAAVFFAAAAAGIFSATAAAGALQRRWRSLVVISVVSVIGGCAAGGAVWVLASVTGFGHCFGTVGDADPVEPHVVHGPTWSPNGRAIAFEGNWEDNHEVYVVTARGGETRRVTRTPISEGAPSWSPTHDEVLVLDDSRALPRYEPPDIYVINAVTGEPRRLTKTRAAESDATWSRDGSMIAFVRNGDIFMVDRLGRRVVRVTRTAASERYPVWSNDGTRLAFFRSRVLQLAGADGRRPRAVTAAAVPAQASFGPPSWSPTGEKLVFAAEKAIYVVTIGGRVLRLPTTHATEARWSPTTDSIAFIDKLAAIYRTDGRGGAKRRLTDDRFTFVWDIVWSPDGTTLAFRGDSDRTIGIYTMNEGSRQTRRVFVLRCEGEQRKLGEC